MEERFAGALELADFVTVAEHNRNLWQSIMSRARVEPDLVERARRLPGQWRLLVLLEDWCGDALNTIPFLARLAELAPGLELRTLDRDRNLDLMVGHDSVAGALSIPVVLILDERFEEVGWWGSRPAELQRWVDSDDARSMGKADRYREMRRWYVRDRGRSASRELLELVEGLATARNAEAAPGPPINGLTYP